METNYPNEPMEEKVNNPFPYAQTTAPATYTVRKLRVPTGRGDVAFAAVLCLLSVLLVNSVIEGQLSLGYAVTGVAITVASCIYAAVSSRVTLFGVYCAACSVVIDLSFAVYTGGFDLFMLFVASRILSALAFISFSGDSRYPSGSWKHFADVLHLCFLTPVERMSAAFGSLFESKEKDGQRVKRTVAVLIGVIGGIIALVVILPLLIKSDAAFEAVVDDFSDDIYIWILSVFAGLVLFALLFPVVFSSAKGIFITESASDNIPAAARQKRVPTLCINAFFAVVSSVYAVYLISQLAYLFNGFSGILPKDFTLAEYARRGFFEMTAVCMINFALISLTMVCSEKNQKNRVPVSTRVLCLFVSAFSITLIATVFAKIVMYMGILGLTDTRIYAFVCCLILVVAFVCVIIRMFAEKFPYFRVCAACVAVIAVAVSLVNVNSLIAGYNYYAYEKGITEEIDVDTIADCGDAGVPYLVKLLDNYDTRQDASYGLAELSAEYGYSCYEWSEKGLTYTKNKKALAPDTDIREYNRCGSRARQLVLEHLDEVMGTYPDR